MQEKTLAEMESKKAEETHKQKEKRILQQIADGGTLFFTQATKSTTSIQSPAKPDTPPITTNLSPVQMVANDVYEQRDELLKAAISEAQGNDEKLMVIITEKIQGKFVNKNLSLDDIFKDETAINILLKSTRMEKVLVYYAKKNKLNSFLDNHLVSVTQAIHSILGNLVSKSVKQAKGDSSKEMEILTANVKEIFEQHWRSFKEIFNNKKVTKFFQDSENLNAVLLNLSKQNLG